VASKKSVNPKNSPSFPRNAKEMFDIWSFGLKKTINIYSL
jgi:hypothetical protein